MTGVEIQLLIGRLREWERIVRVCGPGSHPQHGAQTLRDAADALAGFQRPRSVSRGWYDAELHDALREERCNGCGCPRRWWAPVCGGMTQGDMTHYHSPEWWIAAAKRRANA